MKRVDYMDVAPEAMAQIKIGAFLTVEAANEVNTMTIGWATLGYIWEKPIMMVAVRPSRHTFSIIEKTDNFTVSIPTVDMSDELTFCGTRSGRSYDKFAKCDLKLAPGQTVAGPIINVPGLHYECKIVYKSAMEPALLAEDYHRRSYPAQDYHTLYFGEIVDCYRIE